MFLQKLLAYLFMNPKYFLNSLFYLSLLIIPLTQCHTSDQLGFTQIAFSANSIRRRNQPDGLSGYKCNFSLSPPPGFVL